MGDKVDPTVKKQTEDKIAELKKALESDNTEDMKKLMNELQDFAHKASEAVYKQQASSSTAHHQFQHWNKIYRYRSFFHWQMQ